MPTATLDGVAVDLNDDGFFENPNQWTEAMAPELARAADIDESGPSAAKVSVAANEGR